MLDNVQYVSFVRCGTPLGYIYLCAEDEGDICQFPLYSKDMNEVKKIIHRIGELFFVPRIFIECPGLNPEIAHQYVEGYIELVEKSPFKPAVSKIFVLGALREEMAEFLLYDVNRDEVAPLIQRIEQVFNKELVQLAIVVPYEFAKEFSMPPTPEHSHTRQADTETEQIYSGADSHQIIEE